MLQTNSKKSMIQNDNNMSKTWITRMIEIVLVCALRFFRRQTAIKRILRENHINLIAEEKLTETDNKDSKPDWQAQRDGREVVG